MVFRHLLDVLGHGGARRHNQTARAQLDGQDQGIGAVAQDHGVALFDNAGHGGRVARRHAELAAADAAVDIADDHFAVQRVHQIGIGRPGLGHRVGIEHVHIGLGHVGHGDQALHAPLVVHDGQGIGVDIAHEVPRFAHGHAALHARHVADAQVLHLWADVGAQGRRGHAEILQDELRFTVGRACPAGFVMHVRIDLVFQIRIGDGRTDAVGIGIAVADHQYVLARAAVFSLHNDNPLFTARRGRAPYFPAKTV